MKRHHKTTVGLFMVLIAVCTFLTTPVFVQAQQARADQSEIASLLNSSHVTSWAYYTDPTGKWFISHSNGVTYALGRNSQNHASWIAIANGEAVATVDFSNKKVTLRTDTASRTPNNSYRAISMVSGEAAETVSGGWAREFANLINGNTLDLKWYFFKVESTGKWYIVWINGTNSTIYRLKLNTSLDNYDWQQPLDGSGAAVDTSNWPKSFYQENGAWKVRFNTYLQFDFPVRRGEFRTLSNCMYGEHCRGGNLIHTGIDYLAIVDPQTLRHVGPLPAVYAAADGEVVKIVKNPENTSCQTDRPCADHGLGNTVFIKHVLSNGSAVYSQYSHLHSITNELLRATEHEPVQITRGTPLGIMGASGYGDPYYWNRNSNNENNERNFHLHFEIKKRPVLGNPEGSGNYWGYTRGNPDSYGYYNPQNYFNSVLDSLAYE